MLTSPLEKRGHAEGEMQQKQCRMIVKVLASHFTLKILAVARDTIVCTALLQSSISIGHMEREGL